MVIEFGAMSWDQLQDSGCWVFRCCDGDLQGFSLYGRPGIIGSSKLRLALER